MKKKSPLSPVKPCLQAPTGVERWDLWYSLDHADMRPESQSMPRIVDVYFNHYRVPWCRNGQMSQLRIRERFEKKERKHNRRIGLLCVNEVDACQSKDGQTLDHFEHVSNGISTEPV